MAHRNFGGVYKKAYRVLIEDLKLFPKIRYNKVVERLNRYEGLLMDCLGLFKLEGLRVVDSKPVETRSLAVKIILSILSFNMCQIMRRT